MKFEQSFLSSIALSVIAVVSTLISPNAISAGGCGKGQGK
jgi:hypothetical protein